MRTQARWFFLSIVAALLGACGGEPPGTDAGMLDAFVADARSEDAPMIDALVEDATVIDAPVEDAAMTDAPMIDGGPVESFRGAISIAEVSIQGMPELGQGLQVRASFEGDLDAIPPVYEDTPGALTGCRVWRYTAAEAAVHRVGLDEGSIQISATDGTPTLPPCTWGPGSGYVCVAGAGTGGTIAPVDAAMGIWALMDDTLSSASAAGSYVQISGATTPANNGVFPVVATSGPSVIVFVNARPSSAETLPASATWALVAGAGPIPGAADPGFLEDDDELTVALTPGGMMHVEPFSVTLAPGTGVGDDFTLSDASQATISSIPIDGSAFTIGCAGAGGTCGTAAASIVSITTTDGPVAGMPPYSMPPPISGVTVVRCMAIGTSEITVPAAVAAFLMSSGATRIETTFLRVGLAQVANTGTTIAATSIVAGHGVVGFTTP